MKTKIVYVTGNVLEAPQPIIVHQVNCQGIMGSGVAKAIRESYPIVYQSYRWVYNQVENKKDLLGECQFVDVSENRTIINVFSQFEYLPRTKRHTSYDAMTEAFERIKLMTSADLAMPRIGCGLGGGDWHIVSAIIESVFDDRQIFVYSMD